MDDIIDIHEFIKEILGEHAKLFIFEFDDKLKWKKHAMRRYGYCNEYYNPPFVYLVKHMSKMNVSVATYNSDTNEGVVLDRREEIR